MSSFSGSNIAATDDHRWYWGAYGQDDWKVTPTLTLNLGLRWDYFTPYAEINGRQANFIPAGGNGADGHLLHVETRLRGCPFSGFRCLARVQQHQLWIVSRASPWATRRKPNFAPRVGFAWSAMPNLVVRGGYGTAYGALGNLGYGGTLGTNYPFVYTQSFPSPDSQHPLLLPNGQPATMERPSRNTISRIRR